MDFTTTLEEGIFVRRYKRFFADIELPSGLVTAHVPNTGSLKTCLQPGTPALVSKSRNPKRKLPYTLEFLKPGDAWVGVNTQRPNDLVWEVWHQKKNPAWLDYRHAVREIKLNAATRLDLCLSHHKQAEFRHYVEVKNVTMVQGTQAQFPDAVTARGQKHLNELMELTRQGHSAEIVFTVQRTDCLSFAPADAVDPVYGQLLRNAHRQGVKISVWGCVISPKAVDLVVDPPLPLDFL